MSRGADRTAAPLDLAQENAGLRQRLTQLERALAGRRDGADGQRDLARELVLHRVRERVWQMHGPGDILQVLDAVREGLVDLGIRFHALGLNVLDPGQDGGALRAYNITRSGKAWQPDRPRGREVVERLRREGRTTYRGDLCSQDPYDEAARLHSTFGRPVRSVLDVPVAQGTLALNSPEPNAFSAADVAAVEELAEVFSEAVRRRVDLQELARQKALLEEKTRLIDAFQRVGQAMLSTLDLDQVLDSLAVRVIEAGIFRSLMIALVEEDAGVFHVVRDYGIGPGGVIGDRTSDPERTSKKGATICIDDPRDWGARAIRSRQLLVQAGWGFDLAGAPVQTSDPLKVAYFVPVVGREGRIQALLGTASPPDERETMVRRIEVMQPLLAEIAIALEHARLYQALDEERERLAVTLAGIGDGVIVVDRDQRVVQLNGVAQQLTGWRQQEAAGRSLEEVFRPQSRARPATSPGGSSHGRLEPVRLAEPSLLAARGGGQRFVHTTSAPMRGSGGEWLGDVLVVHDVTREHRLTEELHRAQRIESLAVLAAGIAHDFNNILASALVNVSVLKMQLSDRPGLQQIAVDISTSMERARSMTQQLLDFARGRAATRTAASLAQLVRETADFVLRGSDSRVAYDLPADLWAVSVDSAQISQVFHNLVLNADQAMPGGGEVRISLANVEVTAADGLPLAQGRYVRCSVVDQGCGIASEHLDRIFDPYYTTRDRGSGLGLAAAYSIVSNHGGWLMVDSTPGDGARFAVYLPTCDGDEGGGDGLPAAADPAADGEDSAAPDSRPSG